VARVKSRGPAFQGGLHPGDRIVAVNGVDVRRSTVCRVAELVRKSVDDGGRLAIGVIRGDGQSTGDVSDLEATEMRLEEDLTTGNVGLRRRKSDTGYGSSLRDNVTGNGNGTCGLHGDVAERTDCVYDLPHPTSCRCCLEGQSSLAGASSRVNHAEQSLSRLQRMESFRSSMAGRKLRKNKMAAVLEERTTTTTMTVSRTHMATGIYFRWDDPDVDGVDDVISGSFSPSVMNDARLESQVHVYEELNRGDVTAEVDRGGSSTLYANVDWEGHRGLASMDKNNNRSFLAADDELEKNDVEPWKNTSRLDDVSCQLFPSPVSLQFSL